MFVDFLASLRVPLKLNEEMAELRIFLRSAKKLLTDGSGRGAAAGGANQLMFKLDKSGGGAVPNDVA